MKDFKKGMIAVGIWDANSYLIKIERIRKEIIYGKILSQIPPSHYTNWRDWKGSTFTLNLNRKDRKIRKARKEELKLAQKIEDEILESNI